MAQALAELCADTIANPLKEIQTDHEVFQKTITNKEKKKTAMSREMKNTHAEQISLGIQYLVDKTVLLQRLSGDK